MSKHESPTSCDKRDSSMTINEKSSSPAMILSATYPTYEINVNNGAQGRIVAIPESHLEILKRYIASLEVTDTAQASLLTQQAQQLSSAPPGPKELEQKIVVLENKLASAQTQARRMASECVALVNAKYGSMSREAAKLMKKVRRLRQKKKVANVAMQYRNGHVRAYGEPRLRVGMDMDEDSDAFEVTQRRLNRDLDEAANALVQLSLGMESMNVQKHQEHQGSRIQSNIFDQDGQSFRGDNSKIDCSLNATGQTAGIMTEIYDGIGVEVDGLYQPLRDELRELDRQRRML